MNAFSIILFLIIVVIFGGIIYTAQQSNSKKAAVPSIPVQFPTANPTQQLTFQQQAAQQQVAQQQATNPTAGVAEQPQATYSAVIKTSRGNITLTLFADQAPNTVKNFIAKAKSDYYKGIPFHRVEDWVVQGGDPTPQHDGTGGGQMQTELNSLPFVRGSVGVARGQNINISNDSQFFITKTDAAWLNQQYTNFGTVTSGMDVVDKIKIGDKILGITVE